MNKKRFPLAEYEKVIKMAIKDGGSFRLYPRGTSMLPLLREGIDSVVLTEAEEVVKKYDVLLYKRDNGQYVMHRVIGINSCGYVLCGDNCCVKESGITKRHIIAVVKGIYRANSYIPVTDIRYRLYTRIWCGVHGMLTGRTKGK